MSPNEDFAIRILRILDQGLVTDTGRPDWNGIKELDSYASTGEKTLLNAFYEAYTCASGFTRVAAHCDRATAFSVLFALTAAYAHLLTP